MPPGYNWFLILVAVIVSVLVLLSNVYILIHYSHPEDNNQAWVPKIVVVTGLTISVLAVLMYPLDIANNNACSASLSPSACTYTLPMYTLWEIVFWAMLVLAFVIIPFTLFYYEADSDFTLFQKIKGALAWTLLLMVIVGLIIGILYALIGYVTWDVQLLTSGTASLSLLFNYTESGALSGNSSYMYPCILIPTTNVSGSVFPPTPPPSPFPPPPLPGPPPSPLPPSPSPPPSPPWTPAGEPPNKPSPPAPPSPPHPPPSPPGPPTGSVSTLECIANLPNSNDIKISVFTQRVSIAIYVIAIQSILGWILFMIFAGVGMFAAPISWIQEFRSRPRSTITKSEYIRRGRLIAQTAKECVNMAQMLRRQDKDRRWRSNYKRLEREVNQLEEDEYQLERVFPQGEDGESRWVLFMLSFYFMGFMGVVGVGLSLAWVCHISLYMLPPTGPVSPMLNTVFVDLDRAWSLLGVIFFGLFCLYLIVISMKGNFLLGLNFFFIKLYPMRPGATLSSSLLVNTGIIVVMSPAILQFCAQAFGEYASNSDIFDIFGVQVGYLKGISWLYNSNFFLYSMLSIMLLSSIIMCFRGTKQWERKKATDVYLEDD
ncbi:hypothetical protein CEUSTIGMA_g1356.t1 [Chlamydomonas eustigma]|uniref:LMBR1-like membrane protein n=1 Tax=Chlamydomonas eustigma TaxID=1157962 RepID=A0A250WT35_9CHLO|nr:hypothetical protein CEUSTIGMA_g1356.t1 [Chlamydomonas eustigma]|eukprot:GAX73906.1 hypothetical protein CEUSTIGMA_g1356.t1 [Chlamydomonas eustigma]